MAYQFDLALSLVCCGRDAEGWREYTYGVQRSKEQSALRQQGLIRVALDDLKVAVRKQPALADVPEVKDALDLLNNQLDELRIGSNRSSVSL
jgi:hypothetical protein